MGVSTTVEPEEHFLPSFLAACFIFSSDHTQHTPRVRKSGSHGSVVRDQRQGQGAHNTDKPERAAHTWKVFESHDDRRVLLALAFHD